MVSECKIQNKFFSLRCFFGGWREEEESFLTEDKQQQQQHRQKTEKKRIKKDKNHRRKKNHIRWLRLQKLPQETSPRVRDIYRISFNIPFPSFVFLRATRFTDALSLSFLYFRTNRREDFQDEVRPVPRRRTGGRTQTGTIMCFRRHLFSDTLWSV